MVQRWARGCIPIQAAGDGHQAAQAVRFIPFGRMLLWWIRVLRLIGGTGMHPINHEARINHNLSRTSLR
jgi:hypothetical protein